MLPAIQQTGSCRPFRKKWRRHEKQRWVGNNVCYIFCLKKIYEKIVNRIWVMYDCMINWSILWRLYIYLVGISLLLKNESYISSFCASIYWTLPFEKNNFHLFLLIFHFFRYNNKNLKKFKTIINVFTLHFVKNRTEKSFSHLGKWYEWIIFYFEKEELLWKAERITEHFILKKQIDEHESNENEFGEMEMFVKWK